MRDNFSSAMRLRRQSYHWRDTDDLDSAFKRFFKNVKAGKKPGFPTFKKKGVGDSFSIREKPKFDVTGKALRIEKLKTRIKMRQGLRLNGNAKSASCISLSPKSARPYCTDSLTT